MKLERFQVRVPTKGSKSPGSQKAWVILSEHQEEAPALESLELYRERYPKAFLWDGQLRQVVQESVP